MPRQTQLALVVFVAASFGCTEHEVRVEGTNPGDCSDGADNDLDGMVDCLDSSCWSEPACVGPVDASAPDVEPDAMSEPDTRPPLVCDWDEDNQGTSVGRVFMPLTLNTCDGEAYTIPNPELCVGGLTIVNIAAAWCRPCVVQSEQFEAEINTRYDVGDVRLIQILVQTQDFGPPDEAFCAEWVERFELTNVELIDPEQRSNVYFPDNALPSTLVLDNETGEIVWQRVGAEEGERSLIAELDELLGRYVE